MKQHLMFKTSELKIRWSMHRILHNSMYPWAFAGVFFFTALGVQAQCPSPVVAAGTATSSCQGENSTLTVNVTSPAVAPTLFGGQTNPNPNIAVPDNSCVGASSSINITGATGTVGALTDVSVTFTVLNDFCSDLDIYLVKDGCGTLELSTDNGGAGKDYISTTVSTNFAAPSFPLITAGVAPFTGNFVPEGTISTPPNLANPACTAPAGLYAIPAAPLLGCPINGTWSLWVFDDAGSDLAFIDQWSLVIGGCQYSYSFNVTPPVTLIGTTIATNTMSVTGQIANLPIGVTNVGVTVSNGTLPGTTTINVPAKKYDNPVIQQIDISPNCVTGPNGTITVTMPNINNGNFTGADVGFWQFSINGTTWQTSNIFTGLNPGPYTVSVRNSANISCLATKAVLIVSNPSAIAGGTPPGLIRLCDNGTNANTVNLSATASGGPPGLLTFTQFKACSNNCVPVDNNTISCGTLWRDSILVSGLSGNVSLTTIVSVTLNVNNSWFSDLDIWLVGPNNCGTLTLSTDNGGTNDHFVNVTVTTDQTVPLGKIVNIWPVTGFALPTNVTYASENAINEAPVFTNNGTGIGAALVATQTDSPLRDPSAPTSISNNYPLTPCLYNPLDPLQPAPFAILPKKGLEGCPTNGWWRLVIADDWVAISGTVFNWTLNVSQSDPNYQHTYTVVGPPGSPVTFNPATMPFAGSGAFGFLGLAQALTVPIGVTNIQHTVSRGGCSSPPTNFTVKVYDQPDLLSSSFTCASAGNPGSITLNSFLNNANFTEPADIGIVQFGPSATGPWTTLTNPIPGLAAGSYTYFLRNSASPTTSGAGSCISGPFNITIPNSPHPTVTVANQNINCSQLTATLTAVPVTGAQTNNSYAWSVPATGNPVTVGPSATTTYTVTATSNVNALCVATASATVTVNYATGTAGPPTAVGDSICPAGSSSQLTVTSCPGTVNWYTTLTGGLPVFTGNPYTPTVGATTTFFAECVQGPCVSQRAPVTVQVFPAIVTPLFTFSPTPICSGTPTTFTVTTPTGAIYLYEWFVNGVSQGAASPSTTFVLTNPVGGESITVKAYYYF
jgi:subtilisin-like proprotein convertase family protein